MGQGILVSTLIDELRVHLGEDNIGLVETDALLLLNRSYWEMAANFNWKEAQGETGDTTLALGTQYIELAVPVEAVTGVILYDIEDTKYFKLDPFSDDTYWNNYSTDASTESVPERYFVTGDPSGTVSPDNVASTTCRIYFYPRPYKAYKYNIQYWRSLASLDTNNYKMLPYPRAAHEIVLFGAVWRGWVRFGDYNRAAYAKNFQKGLIDNYVPDPVKTNSDNRMAGVMVQSLRSYP